MEGLDPTGDRRVNVLVANELGSIVAESAGRGATRSRAFVHEDVVLCLLEDGATRAEQTLMDDGKHELVRFGRDALQRAMEARLVDAVERITARSVRSFLGGSTTRGDSSALVFVLAPVDHRPGAD